MEFRDMLKQNVEEFKRKEQERQEQESQEKLKKIKEVVEGIEKDMVEASLKGETQVEVIRIDTPAEDSHVETLKRYFEKKGFKVKVKSQTFFNYNLCMDTFADSSIKHKMIISWEE